MYTATGGPPVIGEVLVSRVFNFADGPRPVKIAKLNPPRTFQRIRYYASIYTPKREWYNNDSILSACKLIH